jgi:hypothetical protein
MNDLTRMTGDRIFDRDIIPMLCNELPRRNEKRNLQL